MYLNLCDHRLYCAVETRVKSWRNAVHKKRLVNEMEQLIRSTLWRCNSFNQRPPPLLQLIRLIKPSHSGQMDGLEEPLRKVRIDEERRWIQRRDARRRAFDL